MPACKLAPELDRRLRAAPSTSIRLLVGVQGDLEERSAELSRRGVVVLRRLALVAALAVEATGSQALALSREPWVSWIEPDRGVRALARDDRR